MKKESAIVVITGFVIGIAAVLLMRQGNPPNMGFCIACFERDIAGALGLHRAGVVQYLRPEIIGIVLGAFITAFVAKEFKPEGGSSPALRFILGMIAMIGYLVFLGCPIRMGIRIGGGDLNAVVGLAGFVIGIIVGVMFLKGGFNLGRTKEVKKSDGWVLPILMVVLLGLLLWKPVFNAEAGGPIFFSKEGPGAMHAVIALSLIAGLAVGVFAQRSRFCTVGGVRDLILVKDTYLISGFVVFILTVLVGALALGTFKLGFVDQPIAHNWHLWNFLGMGVGALASVFMGGCPLRQLILSANGNTDSAVSVLGMITGAAVAHNFMLAASPTGVSGFGQAAVIAGLVLLIIIGFANLEK
jgi:YedE family putative selenium metabolism protein